MDITFTVKNLKKVLSQLDKLAKRYGSTFSRR